MARTIDSDATPTQGAAPALSMHQLGVVDGVGPTELPKIVERPPALLMCHPERWQVSDGMVVPLPGRLPIVGGVGCVEVINATTGALSIKLAKAQVEGRGWQVVPLDVDGPGTSYLVGVPGLPGVYLTRWETAHAGSSQVSIDRKGFARWLASLVDRGIVRPPPPYVLERMKGRLEQQRLELTDRVRTVPSAQVQLDRVLADLAVVEDALDDLPLTPIAPRPTGLGDLVTE